MHLTIAICTWNRAPLLRQTLEHLTRLKSAPDVRWDVLVVDNNSADDTPAVIEVFRNRLPLAGCVERDPGLSNARNAALRTVTADYIFFTDDDVLVDEGWLVCFASLLDRFPNADAFGGPMDPWFPHPPEPTLLAAFPALANGFCVKQDGEERIVTDVRQLQGGNMVLRRQSVINRRFDARLGYSPTSQRGGEESQLLAEIVGAGGSVVWSPTIRVRHYVDPSRMTVQYMRRFSRGLGQETVRQQGIPIGTSLFGAPRWLWRRAIEQYGRYVLSTLKRERFASLVALRDFCITAGMLQECRHLSAELTRPSEARADPLTKLE